MADSLFLSRNTKMFVKTPEAFKETSGAMIFEIPILEGFSVSQTDNSVEITSSEATSVAVNGGAGALTQRGTKKLKTSTNPAEFSFQTYVRPYDTANAGASITSGNQTTANKDTAVEMVLWALMASATRLKDNGNYQNTATLTAGGVANTTVVTNATGGTEVDFNQSKLPQAFEGVELVFQVNELDASTTTQYTITDMVINEATVDFDIEGIATISWSGMGKSLTVTSDAAALTPTVNEKLNTASFIQNKVSSVVVDPGPSLNGGAAYSVVLTGGSVTFTNNVTFITPDTLHAIDSPFTHQLGSLGVTGNLTCYLEAGNNKSLELFTDLLSSSNDVENVAVNISVGGTAGPCIQFNLDHCHLDVPTTNFEDVVSLDVPFTALGDASNLENPPAAKVKYIAG